jgi:integrase/recombinase XerD
LNGSARKRAKSGAYDPRLTDAFEEFMLALEAEGSSRATLRWYRSLLERPINEWADLYLDEVTTHDLRNHLADLRSQPIRYTEGVQKPPQPGALSYDSIGNHIRALHRFFAWCKAEYGLSVDPAESIKIPPLRQAESKGIAQDDLVRLLNASEESTVAGIRNKALIALLADTGSRAAGGADTPPTEPVPGSGPRHCA